MKLSLSRFLSSSREQVFRVHRYDPGSHSKPYLEDFIVDLGNCGPMVLDALNKIKDELDSSLSYRRSCREGICGSCSMNINGRNELACLKYIEPSSQPITVLPLPNTDVLKDLVPDLTNFINQHKSVEPWLHRRGPYKSGDREILQSVIDRKRLDGLYECILCACCSTACPPYWWNPDTYLGPAALLQAYRWISDSRDEFTKERLAWLNDSQRLYRCHGIENCTEVCPKHLDPAGAIRNIKRAVEEGFNETEWRDAVSSHSQENAVVEKRNGLSMS